jgi:hypothetical protein
MRGTKEQQYDIAIEGDKRVWRPAVTVLKLLVAAWGDDATEWVGRRAELYGDPDIMFGREKVGGIRVSRISHIDGPVTANLTETRGKRKSHTVDPLPDAPAATKAPTEPTAEEVAACVDVDRLKAMWKRSGPERRAEIEQRVTALNNDVAANDPTLDGGA